MNLTFGADPELFVFSKDRLLPAIEFLPRKSDTELCYWDGFQAEFVYSKPHDSVEDFVYETRAKLETMLRMAQQVTKDAKLTIQNTIDIPKPLLQSSPFESVMFGCMPSENVYGLEGEKTGNPYDFEFRTAAGHLHFGTWGSRPRHVPLIKRLDSILGVWSVGAAASIDVAKRRRIYGLPGEYRLPRYKNGYGIEYRVLSNFWLCHPQVTRLTLQLAKRVIETAKNAMWRATDDEVIHAIRECDVELARDLVGRNHGVFQYILGDLPVETKNQISQVGLHGVESLVENPHDVSGNWEIE